MILQDSFQDSRVVRVIKIDNEIGQIEFVNHVKVVGDQGIRHIIHPLRRLRMLSVYGN